MANLEKPTMRISREKILFSIIGLLLVILIISFAYIKVQKTFSWERGSAETAVETGVSATRADQLDTQNTKEILPGGSHVTSDNQVLNERFNLADNSAIPNTPEAPKSVTLEKEDLPKGTLDLKIKDSQINPNTFTVKSGNLISLAVSSEDEKVHIFSFYSGDMSAISMGVSAGRTKAITFNAPAPGEYEFGCGVPQHRGNGERGVMIVK